jgi:magnesium transporter
VDAQSVVFAMRCYVECEPSGDQTAYRLRPLELSVVVTGDYLLTLHEERVSLPAALAPDLPEDRTKGYVVYSVLDAIVASTFDALEEVELKLDALAETSSAGWRQTRSTLAESAARLATMRRWVTAEHAVSERISVEMRALRGFGTSDEPYYDRLHQQLDVLLGSIDAAANAMGTLIDLQLNERAYVVSVVATIFVPLTFITGFFGMNFGWMVDRIDSQLAFWLLGFLVPLATALVFWRLGVRRFLVGDDERTTRD